MTQSTQLTMLVTALELARTYVEQAVQKDSDADAMEHLDQIDEALGRARA